MPTYQYACSECGHGFEKRLRMSQSGETQSCPSCGSQETRKRIGAVAAIGGGQSAMAAMPAAAPRPRFS
ncbi:MAG: zinc ribbon domain-containing protein [Ardenticatenaceae bacterium]|nr:zinc ribbon domain-containing protein [Ardenticatenaceae bacterium]